MVVDASSNHEIMRCTARSGVNLTVDRAQEGTAARAFDAGAAVSIRLTAGALEEVTELPDRLKPTAPLVANADDLHATGPYRTDTDTIGRPKNEDGSLYHTELTFGSAVQEWQQAGDATERRLRLRITEIWGEWIPLIVAQPALDLMYLRKSLGGTVEGPLPRTTKIGGHSFYRAGTFPGAGGGGGDPEARGMARLAPRAAEPQQGKGGNITFRNPGQDRLQPPLMNALTEVSRRIGRDLTVTSGYRSPKHPVEARKKTGPGEHAKGSAADIDMRGMSTEERATLVRELQARGAKRFGLYSNTPDMLHVDLKDQSGSGDPWFMFDRTNRKMDKAPSWFRDLSRNRTPVKRGGAIIADENYRPADPMGLYRGEGGPLSRPATGGEDMPAEAQPAAMEGVDQQGNPLDETLQRLNQQDPDRYQLIDEAGFEDWRKEWEPAG
ncbi:D-Ala-D-Ala carboxypeptidase family metallohydrolase [Neoaquamicrobium sediminum]|uniref:D-Ala-D-Ala carboxypeptidase family metallohydrolase n=1 Tax=Neoaquamicrobium sediminum TaxID=1849104 RepID=UPI003BAB5B46